MIDKAGSCDQEVPATRRFQPEIEDQSSIVYKRPDNRGHRAIKVLLKIRSISCAIEY